LEGVVEEEKEEERMEEEDDVPLVGAPVVALEGEIM
jgi:hypothetical protein